MSLNRIVLRDFVLVKELELDLSDGFTVLTGETGAGKSILIGALQLVTGGRADSGLIREGCSRTDVSAEFDNSEPLQQWLVQAGFEAGEGLLLRRTIDQQGKSRAWINASPATASQLRELGEQLLDIHGQHAWQSLTRTQSVRKLLDGYAKVSTAELAALWQRWQQAGRELTQAQAAQGALESERERLQWQIAEVEKLSPRDEEWQALNAEHGKLSNVQALLEAAKTALAALDDDEQGGAITSLNQAVQALQSQQSVEIRLAEVVQVVSASQAQLQDAAHSLRAYLRSAEPDPARLGELDDRLALWLSLARRYRCAPQQLAQVLADWESELRALDAAADLAALEAAQTAAQQDYQRQAEQVSKVRLQAAVPLARSITQAMQGLGMQGGRFEVRLQPLAQAQQSGLEEVQFLVAGHAGSSPRAVAEVASGGELSRLALAVAVTTSTLGGAQTLVFDEVDAGIGGAVASTVGKLMQQLGRDRQVLAVTHLPQVAACADQQLVVSKQLVDGAMLSSVTAVAQEARIAELARMLGGEKFPATSLAHAKEMLRAGA